MHDTHRAGAGHRRARVSRAHEKGRPKAASRVTRGAGYFSLAALRSTSALSVFSHEKVV